MGHSASIAKKYTASKKDGDENSERDSLATVSSFRPTSPLAHTDAKEFSFGPQGSTKTWSRENVSKHRVYYQGNGTVPRMRNLASQRNITASSSTLGSQPRSMREVRHFLVNNPELLAGKQANSVQKREQFGGVYRPKQIKTKQDFYIGLLDNTPTIFGKGVEREKQLKMNQRMYLQLIYPTANGMKYYYPSVRSNRPVGPNDMVVIRREDFAREEDYMKKPLRERSRRPLKPMEISRESPRLPNVRSPSQQKVYIESPHRRDMSPGISPRIPNGLELPSSTPIRELQPPKRKGNEYIDVNVTKPTNSKVTVKPSQRGSTMEVERRYETPVNQERENSKQKTEEEIVFNFDVEELGLKKKPEGGYAKHNRDSVLPLYFRKSLAYNPQHSNGGKILSDPL